MDYRYNIRGWIASINNSQLNVNSQSNDETNDYFGMEFLYETAEAGLNDQSPDEKYFNGNISAIKCKGLGAEASIADLILQRAMMKLAFVPKYIATSLFAMKTSAHNGSQMFRDAKANHARLIGGTQ